MNLKQRNVILVSLATLLTAVVAFIFLSKNKKEAAVGEKIVVPGEGQSTEGLSFVNTSEEVIALPANKTPITTLVSVPPKTTVKPTPTLPPKEVENSNPTPVLARSNAPNIATASTLKLGQTISGTVEGKGKLDIIYNNGVSGSQTIENGFSFTPTRSGQYYFSYTQEGKTISFSSRATYVEEVPVAPPVNPVTPVLINAAIPLLTSDSTALKGTAITGQTNVDGTIFVYRNGSKTGESVATTSQRFYFYPSLSGVYQFQLAHQISLSGLSQSITIIDPFSTTPAANTTTNTTPTPNSSYLFVQDNNRWR